MRRPSVVCALLFLTTGCGDALAPTSQNDLVASAAEIRTAANSITQAKVLGWLTVITDDSMAGRNTPSIGLEKTAQFLADNYHAWGMLPAGENSYRVYREPWAAQPLEAPALSATTSGATTTVYASWNGATTLASWQLLAGSSIAHMNVVASAPRSGFETTLNVAAAAFVQVRALSASGKVLATSEALAPSAG